MKPIKNSVALVVKNDKAEFLIVKRPENEQGPRAGVWGFPAVTLTQGESEIDAAHRVARVKLGARVKDLNKIGDKDADRDEYTLHLSDYQAVLEDGSTPSVPQSDTSMTQYTELKYTSDTKLLFPAAQKGSSCSQVYLQSVGVRWDE